MFIKQSVAEEASIKGGTFKASVLMPLEQANREWGGYVTRLSKGSKGALEV
jgi:hypothetical protein